MSEIPFVTSAQRVSIMLAHDPFAVTREPFPAPTRSSLRAWPQARLTPGPVLKLAEFAREYSWEVRTQYSQGHFPHGTTGRPGALKDVIGVRFGAHPVTDRQAYAIYARNVPSGTWAWVSFMVWGPDLPPAKLHDLAALKAYLLMAPDSRADALADWTRDLRSIEENRKSLAKRTAAARPAKEREQAGESGRVSRRAAGHGDPASG